MNAEEFRKYGHEMIDFIAEYHTMLANTSTDKQTDPNFRISPAIKPGDIVKQLPTEPPIKPESFELIKEDLNKIIMPNLMHWSAPGFFAYFPASVSYPAMLGELLSAGLGQQGMLWLTSPACTELELVVLDWMAKALRLPEAFLSASGTGGGCIQGTASEAILVALVAARSRLARVLQRPQLELSPLLVAYGSDQTHSCLEKGTKIANVRHRSVPSDPDTKALSISALRTMIKEDRDAGRVPYFVVGTFGTTSSTAIDPFHEIAKICEEENMWFHIDAAYAGSACICPEFRSMLDGVELAHSFNFNPHKWLLVNFDCSLLWVRSKADLTTAMAVGNPNLAHKPMSAGAPTDLRDWQIPLGRRFRALKVWFVMRTYGIEGLQAYIRKHLEDLLRADGRFEIPYPRTFALVTYRIKGAADELNQKLHSSLLEPGNFFVSSTVIDGRFVLRCSINNPSTEREHVENFVKLVKESTSKLLK